MAVYFIAQIRIQDLEGYARYTEKATATLPETGVRVLAVDDHPELIEGSWDGQRTVVLEFESENAFRAWYDSPAYRDAIKLRFASAKSNAVLVTGLDR